MQERGTGGGKSQDFVQALCPATGHRRKLNREHKPPTQVNYLSLPLVTRANQFLRYFLTYHNTCLKN